MVNRFTLIKKDSRSEARLGRLETAHGMIETPCFMPVGTQGTVKAVLPRDLKEMGCQILLGNTYHLHLRPGAELIKELGGLHKFMGWDGPILTDSGGYQVFSLGATCKLSEEGVRFQSQLDGSYHMLTPEKVVDIQEMLGSDIAMILTNAFRQRRSRLCAKFYRADGSLGGALPESARSKDQLLFGIVQGGMHEDLRRWCVDKMAVMPFEGFAVGGLGVGEGETTLQAISAYTADLLPKDRPRYLMGVGRPEDILKAIRSGFDMFDRVISDAQCAQWDLLISRQGRTSSAPISREIRGPWMSCVIATRVEIFLVPICAILYGGGNSLITAK